MTTDLEFSRKPRRMTSPPWNRQKWCYGYTGVEVVMEEDPARMAYFARECTWGDVMREPSEQELNDTLLEVQRGRVLGAAFKGGIGFRIRASRSTMDQMLRLAEGSGGAGSGAGAQTTRDNDLRHFNIVVPNTIEDLYHTWPKDNETSEQKEERYRRAGLFEEVKQHVEATRELYGKLVDAGVPPQDARYVALPLGFQTQWFHVMSLGNMIKMCEQRLCNGLTQHETNYLVRVMRDLVVHKYPHMCDNLRSACEKRGECTLGTMLFPPCGAFISTERLMRHEKRHDTMDIDAHFEAARERASLEIRKYYPNKHLYRSEQNDAMQFAMWDIERKRMEQDRPEAIFSMAGPPELLAFKIGADS